jgi:hypothetical protein
MKIGVECQLAVRYLGGWKYYRVSKYRNFQALVNSFKYKSDFLFAYLYEYDKKTDTRLSKKAFFNKNTSQLF